MISRHRNLFLRAVVCGAILAAGCRGSDRPSGVMDLDRLLAPYDFAGKTPGVLKRVCRRARLFSGYRKARVLWKCSVVLLDWYLTAAFKRDEGTFKALARQLNVECPKGDVSRCGRLLITALGKRFDLVRKADPGGRYDWSAKQAVRLLRLQRDEAPRWGNAYLSGMFELTTPGQPVEVQARLVVAGAVRYVAPVAVKTPWRKRLKLVLRTLGFPCPGAGRAEAPDGVDTESGQCKMACPEIQPRLAQAPPELRKRLIAAHCPTRHLGFTDRTQGIYLTRRSLAAARTLTFVATNLSALLTFTRHPLVKPFASELQNVVKQLEQIRLAIPYPEMSRGEARYIRIPYCPVAKEDSRSPVYVGIDRQRVTTGVLPVLAVEGTRTVILGHREGFPFPGRQVPAPVASNLSASLAKARAAWKRIMGEDADAKEVAVYGDVQATADQFNAVLGTLYCAGVRKVRLLMRSGAQGVGGLTVSLAPAGGGKRKVKVKRVDQDKAKEEQKVTVRLTFNRKRMTLVASEGKLKEKPLKTTVGDLSGLREKLERTRRHYRKVQMLTMRFTGDARYLEIARLLVAVMRNSSGRTLYPSIQVEVFPPHSSCLR